MAVVFPGSPGGPKTPWLASHGPPGTGNRTQHGRHWGDPHPVRGALLKKAGHGDLAMAQRLPGLVNVQKAIEHGHRNSWWLPTNSMVIFHSYVNVYQRVCPINMMVIIAIVIDYGFHNDPSYWWIGEMVMNVVNIFWGCHMFRQTHIIYSYL